MSGRIISLASGVLPEFTPPQTAAAAAAAGFDATGIWVDAESWTRRTTRETRARLAEAAMPVLDVEVIWIRPGPDDADHFRILDIGAELGAANALVVSSDPDFGAAADKLGRIVDHAAAAGLRACLEFGLFTEVKTLADALDVIHRCGRPEAALLVDALHLDRSGGAPADLSLIPSARFAYAQLCDAPADRPDRSDPRAIIEEALDLRLMPGDGALPLVAFLEALPANLPLSIELRSKALRDAYPQAADRAAAVARATRTFLERNPDR